MLWVHDKNANLEDLQEHLPFSIARCEANLCLVIKKLTIKTSAVILLNATRQFYKREMRRDLETE